MGLKDLLFFALLKYLVILFGIFAKSYYICNN